MTSDRVTAQGGLPREAPVDARYELLRLLGEGAAGAVFLARDLETGEELALKKLFRLDQRSVLRFKREFRLLADLHHPNCVKLYDLRRADDVWFLTMEYIDGADLEATLMQPARSTYEARLTTHDLRSGDKGAEQARLVQVAETFVQLARGIRAIHQAGLLHRDLKPSNVVVARGGRVVVLDFGLVRGLDAPQNDVTLEGTVAGTPAYMAPEQALGQRLTEASDWYAFGAMLYQAVSGRLPIDASSAQRLIQRKLDTDPAPLGRDDAPPEVAQLCAALLARNADARPSGDRVLQVLGQLTSQPLEYTLTEERSLVLEPSATPARSPLFGRSEELLQLKAATVGAREGRTVVAHVRGTSGSGKSSLVEHFIAELDGLFPEARAADMLVLRGRCYEREAMPFKALDGILDTLVAQLARVGDVEVAYLLPAEVAPLAQLFPVLERLRAVQRLLGQIGKTRADAAQVRLRAERGLRELMTNIARWRPIVLWLDDLQWGDLDSAGLIHDWLTHPLEAPVLMVLSYRSEEMATNPCLRTLLAQTSATTEPAPSVVIELTPLRDADVQALCEQRLGADNALSPEVIARIVREAQGNAFLASQLAALAHATPVRDLADLEGLSVRELVLQTISLLAPAAR
ncbi:MAG: protein kinase, partial [Polyangiales bacterium]